MQVDLRKVLGFRFAVFLFLCGALAVVAGCHRSPSADVVATVNGKEIQRADLDKAFQASLQDNQKLSSVETDIRKLMAKGLRPFLLGALAWFFVACLALVIVKTIP